MVIELQATLWRLTSQAEEEEDRSSLRHASRSSSRHASGSSSQQPIEPDSSYDLVDDLYPTFFRIPQACQANTADLMPEDTDEEALERVLAEEEELDAEDLVAEGEYEDGLWSRLTDPS